MKNSLVDEHSTCGFCESKLVDGSTTCKYCGAKLIRRYIDRPTRALVLYLRIILTLISVFFILLLNQRDSLVDLSIILVLPLILISWYFPLIFFKIKNTNNHVWKIK